MQNFSCGVYVTLNEMAIQSSMWLKAAFQVDDIAGLPVAEGCFPEGFLYGSYPEFGPCDCFYGEAGAIMGDALVNL
jgi:hypothetical protein